MAKPNYDFAKRQRELAKKAKKEEKLRKKSEGGTDADTDTNAEVPDADSDGAEPAADATSDA